MTNPPKLAVAAEATAEVPVEALRDGGVGQHATEGEGVRRRQRHHGGRRHGVVPSVVRGDDAVGLPAFHGGVGLGMLGIGAKGAQEKQ